MFINFMTNQDNPKNSDDEILHQRQVELKQRARDLEALEIGEK